MFEYQDACKALNAFDPTLVRCDMRFLPILLAFAAFGQTPEQSRTLTFAQTPTPQKLQEIVNLIRSLAEMQHVSADPGARTVTIAGTLDQVAFATWAITELDKPATEVKTLVVRQTTFPDARGASAVRIFYPARVASPQEMQELVNGMRSVADLQRVVAVSGTGAIIARGTAEQVALTEWMLRELEQPGAPVRHFEFQDDIKVIAARTPAVRLYFAKQLTSGQELADTINSIRTIGEVMRAVQFTTPRAILIRGTEDQAALADWLMKELDQAALVATAVHDTPFRDTTVRTAFMGKNVDLAGTAKRVKDVTGMMRVAWSQRPRAIVLRGTPGQIALAEGLLR